MNGLLPLALAALALQPAGSPAADLPEPKVAIDHRGDTVASLLRCLDGRATLVSAHRGGVGPGYPENALETFAHTLSRAPMLLEVDLRTARDGVIVLMHDDAVDRTTTGTGKVSELDFSRIRAARLEDDDGRPTGFRAPRLEEALAWARGRAILLLDMKPGVSEAAVLKIVQDQRAHGRAAAIVYSAEQAAAFHRLDRRMTLFHPVEEAGELDRLAALGVDLDKVVAFTGVERPQPELWAALDRRGIPVAHGTLFFADRAIAMTGETAYFAELSARGVDVIATDLHHEAFAALQARGDTAAALRRCLKETGG